MGSRPSHGRAVFASPLPLLLFVLCVTCGHVRQALEEEVAGQPAPAESGVQFPDVWIVGLPDPSTATLARLLGHHEQLEVRPSVSSDCHAAVAEPATSWGRHLANQTRLARGQGRLVVAACAQLWTIGVQQVLRLLNEALLVSNRGAEEPAIKAVLVVRDEPDHIYDAWHAWCWPSLDQACRPDSPSRRPEHARSPELFHQLVFDPQRSSLFPPLNTSQRAQYLTYRSALGERLLTVSAHLLYDRPWETLYRIETFLGIRHQLYPSQLLDEVSRWAGGGDGQQGGPPLQLQAEWQQQASTAAASGGQGAGAGGGAPALGEEAGQPPTPAPMLEETRRHLEAAWAEDCRYLTEKAHVWFPTCPLIAPDGPGGGTRGRRPVLQRRGKAFTAAKLIGLLRSKRREMVRGANNYVQQLGLRNVTLGMRGDGTSLPPQQLRRVQR